MLSKEISVTESCDIPKKTNNEQAHRLLPKKFSGTFYKERTDRNIGWITPYEQQSLNKATVSIAGCGGMGGQVAEKMLRLGVGTIHIADPEDFDVSNINRQFAATKSSVGKSKAWETAQMMRDICDDSTIMVYPQGIESNMLDSFLHSSGVVVDEIEFWNIGSCILLHQAARDAGVPVLNALTVGFAAYMHLFTPESKPVEHMLGMTLEEGMELEQAILSGKATTAQRKRVMDAAISCFIPEVPTYYAGTDNNLHQELVLDRLINEGKAPIIATNPPFAGGLVADHALLILLQQISATERKLANLPASPGYVKIDAATLSISVAKER